jgi:hypothetical protein
MDIPAEVHSAVKAAPTWDLFPVTGTELFSGQVLKAHKLQFDSGATLQLTRLDLPFLAICTNQILLRAPAVRSNILRNPNFAAADGVAGSSGSAGSSGFAGVPWGAATAGGIGQDGTAGTNGGPGGTATLPPLYLFAEEVLIHPGSPMTWFDLALDFSGVRGGAGGAGGPGGSGGNGGKGAPGKSTGFACSSEPGNGGNGGNGGGGGGGAAGGHGSDGGTLFYVGPQTGLDQLAWVKVMNRGGAGGPGGKGGHGGTGGLGGSSGTKTTFCYGGHSGYGGVDGVNGPDGLSGTAGMKGAVRLIVQPSLAELFS